MKDQVLNSIYSNGNNIAQYVSFSPNKEEPNYIHIKNSKERYDSNREVILDLIKNSNSTKINIRSFSLKKMKGNKLIFNKTENDIDEILETVNNNKSNGFYSILNESIDINDGGVSGVVLNDLIEFAPKDTPKCVDKEGVCILPKALGYYILKTIYGFTPEMNYPLDFRVEFSIHPKRQGLLSTHTIIWEVEKFDKVSLPEASKVYWPNNFSQFIGDKVFGLLIANYLNLNVPYSIVIPRNIAPFSFGIKTGLYENWIRTCPIKKTPGKFYSGNSWVDPFLLMNNEEAKGDEDINIASLLSQNAVDSLYSGASIITYSEEDEVIEGVYGEGDSFMIGKESPINLPDIVIEKVKETHNHIRKYIDLLGQVSIEWVFDGEKVWIVQLNQLKEKSYSNIIVKGTPSSYKEFDVKQGLEELRLLIDSIKTKNIGVELLGNIGLTSHFGDLLRLENIPSKIRRLG